jgi:BirA family biotin operon repressor/biotin-[acetyl-CoA-carboxylase] ligase
MRVNMNFERDINAKINANRQGIIIVERSLSSTNLYAENLIKNGAESGTVVIADSQKDGAGRRGRHFFSPPGVGIYMSYIILVPKGAQHIELLTSAAGLAVSNAIDEIAGIRTKIKWPNDIMHNEKKLCGILTKLTADTLHNIITHAIIGIGINVNQADGDFPDELKDTASSLRIASGRECDRAALSAKVITELDNILRNIKSKQLIKELCEKSCTIGREVELTTQGKSIRGFALGIDSKGGLIVSSAEKKLVVTAGEVIHCRQKG